MKKLLDPRNDIVFKLFFSKTKNRSLLISFLEAVLRPTSAIIDVEILNPNIPLNLVDDKSSILDLVVKLNDQTNIDVEMQMAPTPDFKKRLLYYWAKLHSTQLNKGQKYRLLSPTISIAILSYNEFKSDNKAHKIFELRERNDHELYLPDMQLHFLELPKLESWTDYAGQLHNDLYDWMYFFTSSKSISEDSSMSSEIMKKAVEALRELSEDDNAQELARMRDNARINRDIYFHGAFAEGKTEGLAEGEILERQKNISKMLTKGMSPKDIADLLDISIEEITRL